MRVVQLITNACLRKTPMFVFQQVCAVLLLKKVVSSMVNFNLFFNGNSDHVLLECNGFERVMLIFINIH